MGAGTFDPAKKHTFYFRCGRDGSKTLSFATASGAKNVSAYEFEYQIKQRSQYSENVIELTDEDIVRPSNSSIRLDFTDTVTNIMPMEYYGQLNVTTPTGEFKTWITGPNIFHNGIFDGVTETTELVIYDGGEIITITIS